MGISRLISNTANFTTLVHFSFHLRKNSKDSWQVDLRKAAKNSTVIESILCKPISTTTTYFSLFFSFFFFLSIIHPFVLPFCLSSVHPAFFSLFSRSALVCARFLRLRRLSNGVLDMTPLKSIVYSSSYRSVCKYWTRERKWEKARDATRLGESTEKKAAREGG